MSEVSEILAALHENGLPTPEAAAVFCGGPAARGWSDVVAEVRVRIVTEQSWGLPGAWPQSVPLDPGSVAALRVRVADRTVRLTCWTAAQVEAVLAKVTRERFEVPRAAPLLVEAEELLVEDLLTGCVVSGSRWISGQRVIAAAGAFREFVVTRSLGDAEGAVEDALGQLASGDVHSAVLSARKAFGHVVDSVLELAGCYGSYAPELRSRRFEEARTALMTYEEYWRLETMAGLDIDRPADWVEQVVEFCEKTIATHPEHLVRRSLRGPRRGW
ncbi:hypothetical protein [Streptomyces sp. MBT62]|uniref:hypothetical protein n=1 Tax=Streptomyces sp. MBT62 TaxID=2800410 RepID=UPI00190D2F40|nr:hypothetical protein [Streptomyces sp. MBT62]MBK3571229.1 hypothetical protein [Streptomyces sp. MBT62]